MNKVKIIVLFICTVFLSSCLHEVLGEYPESEFSEIKIINNSKLELYYQMIGDTPTYYSYPPNENFFISSNGFYNVRGEFKESLKGNKMCYIWLFDKKVLDSLPWKEITDKNLYVKRYDLSLQDLEEMNWTIIFDNKESKE